MRLEFKQSERLRKIVKNRYLVFGLLFIAGLFLGWILFHSSGNKHEERTVVTQNAKATIWTCSMHPQIRMDHPGKCPICGMDLIPLSQASDTTMDPSAIRLSKEAAQLANVHTTVVSREQPVKEVRLYGKVQADERLIQSQVSHVPGRIEKLMVNFTGEPVRKGQPLASVYSPELLTAQQELLEAAGMKSTQPEIYEAAKEKLRLWKLSDNQINSIESSGKTQINTDVTSNTSGVVISRRVSVGDHISEGTVLFEVADLSHVWILFDAYESDLPFLKNGDPINFTIQAVPGKNFKGLIRFIDPVIDPATRVAKVRVEMDNSSGLLKPEMFATGIVDSRLETHGNSIVVPQSAVLWTGKRSIVYVKQPGDEPIFTMREVELGPRLTNSYVIMSGLQEGEEIVTEGTFSVDAAAQLEGKPSMMNPTGGTVSSMPGMIMPGDTMKRKNQSADISSKDENEGTQVNMDFIMQLNGLLDSYIQLKNDLFNGDPANVKKSAGKLKAVLSNIDLKLLSGDAHTKWMDIYAKMQKHIVIISSSGEIEDQRMAFADLSDQMYRAVKAFGLMGKTVYYQFCPMARNNKGAFWLSETNTIRNPYFGSSMPSCGDTKETLKFK